MRNQYFVLIGLFFLPFVSRAQCITGLLAHPIGSTSLVVRPNLGMGTIADLTNYFNSINNPIVNVIPDEMFDEVEIVVTNALDYDMVIGALEVSCPDLECVYRVNVTENYITIFPQLPQAVFDQVLALQPYTDQLPSASGFVSYIQYADEPSPALIDQIEALICAPEPVPTMGFWMILCLGLASAITGVLVIQKKPASNFI